MLLQIAFPHATIFANRRLLSLSDYQIGKKVVSNLCRGTLRQARKRE